MLEGENSAHAIFELDALQQDLLHTRRKDPLKLNNVALHKTVGRMGGAEGQIPVICEEN